MVQLAADALFRCAVEMAGCRPRFPARGLLCQCAASLRRHPSAAQFMMFEWLSLFVRSWARECAEDDALLGRSAGAVLRERKALTGLCTREGHDDSDFSTLTAPPKTSSLDVDRLQLPLCFLQAFGLPLLNLPLLPVGSLLVTRGIGLPLHRVRGLGSGSFLPSGRRQGSDRALTEALCIDDHIICAKVDRFARARSEHRATKGVLEPEMTQGARLLRDSLAQITEAGATESIKNRVEAMCGSR